MLKEQIERVEKAALDVVNVFANHGLTLEEATSAIERIGYFMRLQSNRVKVNRDEIITAIQIDDGMLMAVIKEQMG